MIKDQEKLHVGLKNGHYYRTNTIRSTNAANEKYVRNTIQRIKGRVLCDLEIPPSPIMSLFIGVGRSLEVGGGASVIL